MKKSVTINESNNRIHLLVAWAFAYRKARESTYELLAIDRYHFKRRIERSELILKNILSNNHRCKIYNDRFK